MTRPGLSEGRGVVPGERTGELPPDHVHLAARLALGELLADAQDRAQARLDRAGELPADQLVGLARVAPPLGVADDDPVREAGQHRRRDLAGVGALELVMDVLGADPDIGVRLGERVADGGQATNGGQMTRMTPSPRVRAAIVRARSPASAGVVCIFQLAATITSRIAANHARAGRAGRGRRAGLGIDRRQALEPLERALDGGAMDLEPLGQLGEARLRRLAPRLRDEPDDVRLGRPAGRRPRACRSRRAAGRRR